MVASKPDLLQGGLGDDGDDERGKLLENPLVYMHVVGFHDEGAVLGVGQLPPDNDVKRDCETSAAVPRAVKLDYLIQQKR